PADSLSTATVSRDRFLEPQKSGQGFVYRASRTPRAGQYAVWLPIDGDTLDEGDYELKTVISDGVSTLNGTLPFKVRWIDKPRSLRNMQRAIEALQYIAGDSVMDQLRSASPERQRALEYYRRVDYATENFGSLREPDGMKSDRGKVHILYGPPAKVERMLTPGTDPREIWSYPNLRKRLIFVDASHRGEYKLLETQSEDK
ncbi:MAG: GWxTD domain-containing protein, partial [Ignavibacteria bacterium]